jgi:4'-phosphopantetheinyl transferase
LGIKKAEIDIKKNEYGKPFLQHYSGFQFNVSHAGELLVCASDKLRVGIDVEKIKEIDCIKLAKRFFSREEYEDVRQKKNRLF